MSHHSGFAHQAGKLFDETDKNGDGKLSAAEVEADLIVLPSHGKGAVRAALIGSTSEEVIRDAPAPVLVLPRRWLEQAAR
ncbi:MAG: universal stress protein [Lentisphaeria bacterium]|nr:universal stress protein [Lentisphaeria bacterium]